MFEIRENIEDTTTVDEANIIATQLSNKMDRLYKELQSALEKHDMENVTICAVKLKYYAKVVPELYIEQAHMK